MELQEGEPVLPRGPGEEVQARLRRAACRLAPAEGLIPVPFLTLGMALALAVQAGLPPAWAGTPTPTIPVAIPPYGVPPPRSPSPAPVQPSPHPPHRKPSPPATPTPRPSPRPAPSPQVHRPFDLPSLRAQIPPPEVLEVGSARVPREAWKTVPPEEFPKRYGTTREAAEAALQAYRVSHEEDFVHDLCRQYGLEGPVLVNWGPSGLEWGLEGKHRDAKGRVEKVILHDGKFYRDYKSLPGWGTKCLPGDVLISTPSGDRPVRDLRVGDLVWSEGRAVPVLQVHRQAVPRDHELVEIVCVDGARLAASPLHPVADGRHLEELLAGDRLGGRLLVSVTRVPCEEASTYDLLPDTPSGRYRANGFELGSTLGGDLTASCREAVAWTFGLEAADYGPLAEA